MDKGRLAAEEDTRIRARAKRAITEAVAFAKRSPHPNPATLEEGLYA